jgi:RNA polymerase sigma-70 factor, ECF subfamily
MMDKEFLAKVYDEHGPPIYRFLCGFLGHREDAADVVQNVFTRLAKRGLEGIADIRTYLWTSARNEARSLGRRGPTPHLVPGNGHPVDPADREAVEAALRRLPEEQREVVILHVLESLTFQEISVLLEISPDTAASRFRYAREKLKELL